MHTAFHDSFSEFAQVYSTTILNSQSVKMIVFRGFIKYEHFLPDGCKRDWWKTWKTWSIIWLDRRLFWALEVYSYLGFQDLIFLMKRRPEPWDGSPNTGGFITCCPHCNIKWTTGDYHLHFAMGQLRLRFYLLCLKSSPL